jgi:hypothetical protein
MYAFYSLGIFPHTNQPTNQPGKMKFSLWPNALLLLRPPSTSSRLWSINAPN